MEKVKNISRTLRNNFFGNFSYCWEYYLSLAWENFLKNTGISAYFSYIIFLKNDGISSGISSQTLENFHHFSYERFLYSWDFTLRGGGGKVNSTEKKHIFDNFFRRHS